jgi:hypothetical protein
VNYSWSRPSRLIATCSAEWSFSCQATSGIQTTNVRVHFIRQPLLFSASSMLLQLQLEYLNIIESMRRAWERERSSPLYTLQRFLTLGKFQLIFYFLLQQPPLSFLQSSLKMAPTVILIRHAEALHSTRPPTSHE